MENEGDFSKNLIENKDVIHKRTTKTIFLKNSGKQRRFSPIYSEKQKCPLINRQQRGFFVKKNKKTKTISHEIQWKKKILVHKIFWKTKTTSVNYTGKQRRFLKKSRKP